MKKIPLIVAMVVLAVALILGGCKPAAPAGPDEIRIGCNAPLTGVHAGFGEGNVWGERAAVDDINKLGGLYIEEYGRKIPIEFVIVDNESDAGKSGTLEEDLILRGKVHFLADPNQPIDLAIPEATVAERHEIVRVSGGTPMEAWLAVRREATPLWEHSWTYTLAISEPPPAGSIWDKPGYLCADSWKGILDLLGEQTNKKVAIFASDEPDGRSWYEVIPTVFEAWGYDVVGEERDLGLFPMETTDFTPMIEEWKDYGCEILWGNCPAPLYGTLWRQCHALGFRPKVVCAIRAHLFYEDVSAWGGDLPLGVMGDHWWSPAFDPEACPGIGGTTPQSLFERWVEDTGKPLNPGIGWGYNGIQILADAIERAGSLDSEKVCQALSETDMATISSPRVMFNEEHCARLPVFFSQWQKTDQPWVWECPVVLSYHDFLPAEAEPVFPVP